MVASEIASELNIPNSTLSHYLEKLKNRDLVRVRREGTFLWYTANDEVLQDLVAFLYQECCTRGSEACCTGSRTVQQAKMRRTEKVL